MHGGSDFNYAYRSEDTSIGPCEFAVSPWISGFQNSMTAEDGVGHEARKSNCAACVGKGTELQLVCIKFPLQATARTRTVAAAPRNVRAAMPTPV